jgi:trans-aconitate 2-methyltransferase
MPEWNAGQYLRFAEERTRPSRDLAARIALEQPARVIDLGCGPANSTAVLARQWPSAEMTGLDNSGEMLRSARGSHPEWQFEQCDIAEWANRQDRSYDVVFSNAALQWVDNHAAVFPQLLSHAAPGGALAIQMPARDSPAHDLSRSMANSAAWRSQFTGTPADWSSHDSGFYYDVLAPHAARLDIWETTYVHVLDSPADIVEWYKGTGLRPFLNALESEPARQRFLAQYLAGIEKLYRPRADGRVLFPFHRIFVIAYR